MLNNILKIIIQEEIKGILSEGVYKKISPQEASKLFGPVYHGTTQDNRDKIEREGFKYFIGTREDNFNISNGYQNVRYSYSSDTDVSAPIHHLGFGVYFTTSKSIAKDYNHKSTTGLKPYFLDINPDRLLTINFASPNMMMKWWIKNGYDPSVAKFDRVAATKMLTDNLSSQYDAIWFKGKTIRKALDGDQVCVYDTSIIRELDQSLARSGEIGSKVIARNDIKKYLGSTESPIPAGTKGVLVGKRWNDIQKHYYFEIKWKKGGITYNNKEEDIEFY